MNLLREAVRNAIIDNMPILNGMNATVAAIMTTFANLDKLGLQEGINMLYRTWGYSSRLGGYLVYRHVFSVVGPSEDQAAQHKTAVFVTEEDARQYCDYRNYLTDLYGTDRVPDDLWTDATL